LSQTRFKRKLNENGVIDSNSVIFHFLLPSLFAAIFSGILQGVSQTSASASLATFNSTTSTTTPSTVNYASLVGAGRDSTVQGAYQMAGWAISVGSGAVAGLIIGVIYRLLNDNFTEGKHFFNDFTLFEYPKMENNNENQADGQNPPAAVQADVSESRKAL
jgi:hypothetical protein